MKWTRFLPLYLTNVLIVIAWALFQCATLAASHSWLGSTSAFWTVGSNWTNGTPASGDDLYFVSGGLNNRSNYNNFPSGTAFRSITISEGNQIGYVLAGNPITLNNGIAAFGTTLSIQPQLDFNITAGAYQTWTSSRSLALNGVVDLHGSTVVVSNSGSVTFTGTVTDNSAYFNNGYILKENSGLLYFTPGSQVLLPYSGQSLVRVGAGTLRFDGYATNEAGAAPGNYTVEVGAGTVSGTGTIDSLAIEGGTLIPGDSAPGILHCQYVDLTGTLVIPINGTNLGVDYSQLSAQLTRIGGEVVDCSVGTLTYLNVQLGYTPQIGDSYQIMTGLIGDYFEGLAGDTFLQTNGFVFGIAYRPTGVSLTTVRAPDSTFALWTGSTNMQSRWFSDTNNWLPQTTVTNLSRLEFTPYQYRNEQSVCYTDNLNVPPLTNDWASGTEMASILFTGSNYMIYGNTLEVAEGITNQCSSGTNSCFFPLNASLGLTMEVDAGGVLQMAGGFTGGNPIHKVGGGEFRYTGVTSNLYNGPVSLEEGSARVDGSFLVGTFEVHGGTLTGTGIVRGLHMFGGTLSPGPGTAVMQLHDNFEMDSGSVFQVELNNTALGSGYDAVEVSGNGNISLLGGQLDLRPTNNIPSGSQFIVILNDTANAIVGTFAGLPEGATFFAGGQFFSITYKGGDGNDVVVTRANPPATFSTISQTASNAVQLSGMGGSNLSYTIQATTNLTTKNWVNIGTAPVDGTGHFSYTDTNMLLYPQRFFRAVAP